MNKEFFINNRKKFAEKMKDYSVAVFFSKEAPRESLDQSHKFVVDRNFFYLTGINKENMVLAISKVNGVVTEQLFIPPVNETFEKWFGIVLRKEEAQEISGIQNIVDRDSFESTLCSKLSSMDLFENLYIVTAYANMEEFDDEYRAIAKKVKNQLPSVNILNSLGLMMELRVHKQPEEIEEVKTSIKYTKEALEFLMKNMKPDMYEYQVRAHYEYQLMLRNSSPSFATIAASGKSGVILHHVDLKNQIHDGELVLCDLGALSNMYASDITRTYPVNGKFTQRQKDIYNIVLGAQDVTMDIMKPGISEIDVNNAVIKYFAKELKAIKLISDDSEVSKYYYHSVGHPLGLDLHDLRCRDRKMAENNIYTVEPGLYIAEEGIGIRIEDDVLVTKNGNINLSKDIIKTVNDIENFMK
ncbi:aminopeptidase P N-terminal domain-containing protein [Sedimentibacter sp. zth1]|uniref:aminopeptidase P family protein n=1 Tax=Sedimentibacter sp. zth1 TaxID=2816908 RepID=UPI001A921D17|nr:aminopeptidase P family protein [Sedimentibacter sp. zth1]QSX07082.1 aminopeptidase P N-terminal domain-containing protein [Sedimentibacter sp. zth1]